MLKHIHCCCKAGILLSHPWHNCKDLPRMGHPRMLSELDKHWQQGAQGSAAMAEGEFGFKVDFGHGAVEFG